MHFFIIKYKDGTEDVKYLESGSGTLYFEILLDCVTNPKIESYRKFTGDDVTDDRHDFVKKVCERYLFDI